MFKGRNLLIATKHKKEKVIAQFSKIPAIDLRYIS